MANTTSSSRRVKVDENNNRRCVSEMGPTNSSSPVSDAAGLRRSARETLSKKTTPSPLPSPQKSEQLGKRKSLSPVVRRKSERFEKKNIPSPLRRSKRTMNNSTLASLDVKSMGSSISKQKKLKKQKSVKQLTFEAKGVSENEELDAEASPVKNKRMNAREYRAMLKKKPKIDGHEESNRRNNLVQEGGNNKEGKIAECLKGSYLDCKEVYKNLPSENAKESINLSAKEDRGEIEVGITSKMPDKEKETSAKISTDDEQICLICKCGGQLLFCNGKGCNSCYHISCLEPPMVDARLGVWHCHLCLRKKIQLGVYSVSEGVESICDTREVEVSNLDGLSTIEKQFLVKYKGLAYVHCRWVPESQLLLEAPLLLKEFNQQDQRVSSLQVLRWKPEWSLPHRLLHKRASISTKQHGDPMSGQAVDNFDCHYEWLVKWRGLGYEHASWELDNASFLNSPEGQRLIKDYEDRHQRAKSVTLNSKNVDRVSSLSKLSQMPGGISPGYGNNNLDAVNKLREHWQKGQNAIIIDDHDRIVKVVAFVLSLHNDTYRPFLIISTTAALQYWEDEFSRWASSVNVIVYSGNKEIRRSIRKLEFWDDAGCLLFRVLIVLPDIIIEDLDVFGGIAWEAIIVDECSKISSSLKQTKMLNADLRILLLSGQLKDNIIEYNNILALLDCQHCSEDNEELICNSSDRIGVLKDKLSSYVAYRCKSDFSRFVEYWIPVKISNVQLELYCATLLSNSSTLRSSSCKSALVEALRDILITTRKSIGGFGKVSIGDILDDFMRQRFGPDSYERVDKYVVHSKKQNALKMFNNKDHGRFVFLLETNACLPSIKLSSVDTIIIFDSDWNPLNDIRSLQRITLDSKLERIKIFRLYSSFTVEERALILAKQDKPLDSNLQNISWSISHMLLMWGASWLFDDLKAFHDSNTDGLSMNSFPSHIFLLQAIEDFSSVLKQDNEENDTRDYSILQKVQQNGATYRTHFSLHGEWKLGSQDEGPSHLFWTNVLEGKNPRWKYSGGSSQRSRKRVQLFDGSGNRTDFETEETMKKRTKVINNVDQPSSKSEVGKLFTENKERPRGNDVEYEKVRKLHDEQRSLHFSLKSEIVKLCEGLRLPENVKRMAGEFLEYVMNHHHVNRESVSILQAFQISLCWIAASLVKHKIDHEGSLMIAKELLHFECKKEEADYIYSMLRCLKKIFLYRTGKSNYTISPKASDSSSMEWPPEVELAVKDVLKSIKEIQKKCQKKLMKLSHKHEEDKNKLNKTYEEEKADLEKKYQVESVVIRSITPNPNDMMRTEKLRALDIEYTRRIEDLKCQHEILLKDLETAQLAARQKFKDRETTWVEDVKSWAGDELLNILPSKEHGNGIKYLKTGELAEGSNFDRIVEAIKGTGVGLSNTPETISPVEVPCRKPVETQSPLFKSASANEVNDKAQNACDNQGKVISIHSHSEEHNSDGTASMIKKGEGHGSENDITVDPPLTMELISDGAVLNVSNRELSSKLCGNPPLPVKQIFDRGSSCIHAGQIPVEVPETSCDSAECHNGREHQTDVVLLDEISITLDEQVPRDVTVGEMQKSSQQVEQVPIPGDVLPADHSNLEMGQVPSAESLPSNLDAAGEKQNSSQQVEAVCSPVDALPADKSNHDSNMNPLEQAQQLPSAESLPSTQDASAEMQNSSQIVEQICSPVDALPADQSNQDSNMEPLEHMLQLPYEKSLTSNPDTAEEMQNSSQQVEPVSLAIEPQEPVQQLSIAESPSLNQYTSGEMHNSSQQVEAVSREVDVAPANQSNSESLVMEPLERVHQSPSTESPNSNQDPSVEITNQAIVQPSELDSHTSVSASSMHSSDTRNVSTPLDGNNRFIQTATQSANRMLPPLYSDPLKNELERLRKEAEQNIKNHEEMKLQLKSDCEREIEEIRRKYDKKLQETETEFQLKKNDLDTSLNLVCMNKIWAEAFRSKCQDLKVSGASGLQQDASSAQQLERHSRQHRDTRSPLVASSSCRPPASTLQHFSTMASLQTMVPSSQAAYSTPGIGSVVPARPPHINPIIPPSGNHQAGSGFRATPPHLQAYRPSSTSMHDASLSTPPHGISSQQPLNNIPAVSSFSHHPPPAGRPTYLHVPPRRVHWPERSVGLPLPNLPSMEPNFGANNQLGVNLSNSILRMSNVASLNQPMPSGPDSSMRDSTTHQATSADLVCLSDDD
ncbi:helicase protein MOM1-like isoform X1 [Senna tora]|uniref:Helicase protein MOM1-like isoform X1 n=1 Tax=Senna tora TaxID=362788 RepID=A0A834SJY6_9FABA|nr:helicase protein MOM1-like isoform X1 [Senna tora]